MTFGYYIYTANGIRMCWKIWLLYMNLKPRGSPSGFYVFLHNQAATQDGIFGGQLGSIQQQLTSSPSFLLPDGESSSVESMGQDRSERASPQGDGWQAHILLMVLSCLCSSSRNSFLSLRTSWRCPGILASCLIHIYLQLYAFLKAGRAFQGRQARACKFKCLKPAATVTLLLVRIPHVGLVPSLPLVLGRILGISRYWLNTGASSVAQWFHIWLADTRLWVQSQELQNKYPSYLTKFHPFLISFQFWCAAIVSVYFIDHLVKLISFSLYKLYYYHKMVQVV